MNCKQQFCTFLVGALLGLTTQLTWADNPLVTHIYTADPSARVFNDTLYIFPSHDIAETENAPGYNGFRMEDYHVFSSTDLMHFTDHGVILKDEDLSWVSNAKDAMWAPDCIEKNGKYYFYFPGDFKVGLAVAKHPTGPYTPIQNPIEYANNIDPNIFIDDDGTPYLYFGGGDYLSGMRLKNDMFTPDMKPVQIQSLQVNNYKEGSWVFKRNGIYYYTYPVDLGGGEQIYYATGNNPLGPFTPRGTIMDAWTDGCWTNHHSILEYKGQWYIFYHHKDISGDQTLRSMCADKLYFNEDGSIQKVNPTYRGIGIKKATEKIQMDRYSQKNGLEIRLLQDHEPLGWMTTKITNKAWVQYNDVDFGTQNYAKIIARVACKTDESTMEVRLGSAQGKLIGTIQVPNTGGLSSWATVSTVINEIPQGLQNVVCLFKTPQNETVQLNWISFVPENYVIFSKKGTGNGSLRMNGEMRLDSLNMTAVLPYKQDEPFLFEISTTQYSQFDGWEKNGSPVDQIDHILPGDEITALFSDHPPLRKANDKLEAEDYDVQEGIQTEGCSEGGKNIAYVENGDFIQFENIDFANGMDEVSLRVASGTNGGNVQLFVDAKTGSPLLTIPVTGTGGWQNWQTLSKEIDTISGVHDLYFVFEGGAGYLFNVNWFSFKAVPQSTNAKFISEEKHFVIYPNPVSQKRNKLTVQYQGASKTHFQVYDMLGNRVGFGALNPGDNQIDLSSFQPNAFYIFRAGDGTFSQVIHLKV